ncbi:MAG: hypothetical protein JRE23_00180 [Deltaproteobacteria bacterium]|nr:hypothetical protein [Deltaproteobacteria bacterium]
MFRVFKQGNTAKLIIAITTSQFSTGAKFTASNIKATFYKLNGANNDLEIDTGIGASGVVTLTANKLGKTGWHTALIDFSAITAKQYIVVYEATIDSVNAISQEFLDVSAELARLALCALETTSQDMETNLTAGHDAIEVEIAGITTERVNILSATGYVKNIYWASGGKYFVKESEDIDIPFGFEGNPTGLKLWFAIGKDLKNAPIVTKELIEGTDWDVVDVDGVDTVEGIIPFAYADTDTLHGKYTAAVIVRTSETEAYTGWESLLVVDRPVARAEDLA